MGNLWKAGSALFTAIPIHFAHLARTGAVGDAGVRSFTRTNGRGGIRTHGTFLLSRKYLSASELDVLEQTVFKVFVLYVVL